MEKKESEVDDVQRDLDPPVGNTLSSWWYDHRVCLVLSRQHDAVIVGFTSLTRCLQQRR